MQKRKSIGRLFLRCTRTRATLSRRRRKSPSCQYIRARRKKTTSEQPVPFLIYLCGWIDEIYRDPLKWNIFFPFFMFRVLVQFLSTIFCHGEHPPQNTTNGARRWHRRRRKDYSSSRIVVVIVARFLLPLLLLRFIILSTDDDGGNNNITRSSSKSEEEAGKRSVLSTDRSLLLLLPLPP